jgi:NADPH:quinone reductase-like Zn-dependent oxidoreductase
MKAVQIRSHGGAEALEYVDAPDPALRADEIMVRVRACALNRLDLWVRNGIPGAKIRLPHILGSDIAGEICAVGALCSHRKTGERVVLSPGLGCRRCAACLDGRDNECREYRVLGMTVPGGNRELISVPEYAAIPIPDWLTFEQAASAPMVYLTAYHMLQTRARLQPGEDVLVLAASSGVGMAAIQIAKLFHCRVFATVGSESKREQALRLGADIVFDHYRQKFGKEIRRLTEKRGVDVIVEHVGSETWQQSLESLAPAGRIVTCGATTGYDVRIDLRYLFAKQYSILGSYMGTQGELHRVLRWIFAGKLSPVVDSVFPLQETRAAHLRMERKEHFGKIVVSV